MKIVFSLSNRRKWTTEVWERVNPCLISIIWVISHIVKCNWMVWDGQVNHEKGWKLDNFPSIILFHRNKRKSAGWLPQCGLFNEPDRIQQDDFPSVLSPFNGKEDNWITSPGLHCLAALVSLSDRQKHLADLQSTCDVPTDRRRIKVN